LALKADPHILYAGVYTGKGQLFAVYSRTGARSIPPLPALPRGQVEKHLIGTGEISLVRSVILDGRPSGFIYLQSDVETLNNRLELYIGIASLVLLISLLAALAVSAVFRKSVAQPDHQADRDRQERLTEQGLFLARARHAGPWRSERPSSIPSTRCWRR